MATPRVAGESSEAGPGEKTLHTGKFAAVG
jgi:hypothetical protein